MVPSGAPRCLGCSEVHPADESGVHSTPPQFMNWVYPSAPVTMTSIQMRMASAEGATM